MAKIKARRIEAHNHYANNPAGTAVTPETALAQGAKYNTVDPGGHLYGAIFASARDYIEAIGEVFPKKGRTYVWRMLGFIEYANKAMAKPFK